MTLLCHLVVVGVLHDGGAGHLHDAAARPLGLADEVAIGEGAEEAHRRLHGLLALGECDVDGAARGGRSSGRGDTRGPLCGARVGGNALGQIPKIDTSP